LDLPMNARPDVLVATRDLLQRHQSLALATTNETGEPNSSSAPYLLHQGSFFVLVSGLARHTANLLHSGRCHIQVLADEQETVNPFARKRVSYACSVERVTRPSSRADELLILLRRRFGPTIDMLGSLPDFQLLELIPQSGSIVLGFGQAHTAPLPIELN
jgi:putative heme iron utilization protein